jgi:hypothetical protein
MACTSFPHRAVDTNVLSQSPETVELAADPQTHSLYYYGEE